VQAIVLAGGLGTRLRAVLGERPKVLAPVLGKPWLLWLLEHLHAEGFSRVCLATGYKGAQVAAAIGRRAGSRKPALRVLYSREEAPLGTGGALARALPLLAPQATFALNGDTLVTLRWREMLERHRAAGAALSIAARAVEDRSRYGAIEVAAGRVVGFGEKDARGPGLINAGVYVLAADLFARCPAPAPRFSFETDFIQANLGALRPAAYVTDAGFLDIGVPRDLARAAAFIARTVPGTPSPGRSPRRRGSRTSAARRPARWRRR
jgi:D-glycero-alpha-D-manno-heptose 1-phosphate guanylyltransferase